MSKLYSLKEICQILEKKENKKNLFLESNKIFIME